MPVTSNILSRRTFLVRAGLAGAAVAVGQAATRRPAAAQSAGDLLGPLLEQLNPVLQQLAHDTLGGICAFVVPGPDPFSQAQGLTDDRPGAVAAGNIDFMLASLDNFLPFPDTAAKALVQSFAAGVSHVPVPAELTGGLLDGADAMDEVLLALLENDEAIPTSLLIAGYFNLAASLVSPASVAGGFTSPFANLTFEEKGTAFAMIEEEHADLVAMIDSGLPEPLDSSISGLLKFVPGAVLEFVAFGTYSEWHAFDPDQPFRLRERPVGWELSRYQEGQLEAGHGWDEFQGYYRNVRAVEGSWDRGEGVRDRA